MSIVSVPNGVLLYVSTQNRFGMGIFTPQKLANPVNQGFIYCFDDYLDLRKWWRKC